MLYNIRDLVTAVRVALDRNMTDDALSLASELTPEGDVATLDLDALIRSKVGDALTMLYQSVPVSYLGNGKAFGGSIGWESAVGYGAGYIILPQDFLRLITFQMSDWSVPVTEPIDESDPLYLRQQSRWGGVRGNPQKPVVAIVNGVHGRVLEFYCCNSGGDAHIKKARYLSMPSYADGDTSVEVPDRLQRALVYQVAELVALTLGESALAQSLDGILKGLVVVAPSQHT